MLNNNGKIKYIGYLANNTLYDIYFVELCFVSLDSDGKIIDISTDYVHGTNYEYSLGTTDTHISPLRKAPFEISTSASFDQLSTYDYRVYFYKADKPSAVEGGVPLAFALKPNYPNPFNPTTIITFSLTGECPVVLDIYNTAGQKVTELVNAHLSAGEHSIVWDSSEFPSGLYFYRIVTPGQMESRKMILVK